MVALALVLKQTPADYGAGEYLSLRSVCVSQFAVHLGVARGSSVVLLEQTGKNSGYRDRDVCGFCPESHCCVEGGAEKLDSVVNMRAVAKQVKQADVIYSRDAGR